MAWHAGVASPGEPFAWHACCRSMAAENSPMVVRIALASHLASPLSCPVDLPAALQALTSPISGLVGDRYDRTYVVAFGCLLWGVMTAAIGLSRSLGQALLSCAGAATPACSALCCWRTAASCCPFVVSGQVCTASGCHVQPGGTACLTCSEWLWAGPRHPLRQLHRCGLQSRGHARPCVWHHVVDRWVVSHIAVGEKMWVAGCGVHAHACLDGAA